VKLFLLRCIRFWLKLPFFRKRWFGIVRYLMTKTNLLKGVVTTSRFDRDLKVKLNLEDWIMVQIFFLGIYESEKEETAFWQHLIQPGNNVVDIGGHIGYYSLMASKRAGETGKVIAFEPVKRTHKRFTENIALNNVTNIELQHQALFNSTEELEIYVGSDVNWGMSSFKQHEDSDGKTERIKAEPFDEFVKRHPLEKIDVIKMDAEGSEPYILEGMKESLEKFKPMLLIEIDEDPLRLINMNKEEFMNVITGYNYKPYEIVGSESVRLLTESKEKGLVLFVHYESQLPAHIHVVSSN
jgi:FkbM family methyltransferase